MKNTLTRKRLLLSSVGAAAVAAAIITSAVITAPRPGPEAAAVVNPAVFTLAPTVPALAAADSDTVVLAPYSADWWEKVASMAPTQMGLLKLDSTKAGTPILRLGYSRGPDHVKREIPNTGPLRLVYLEAASADDAEQLAVWLRYAEGFESRRVFVQDRTVIISQSWDTGFTVPEKAMASVSAYAPGAATEHASMWMNVDQEVASLAGGADTKAGQIYSAVMSKGIGFKPGTTWNGFSDNGDAWEGDYGTGGVSKDSIDFEQVQSVLTGQEKVLFEVKSGVTTTKMLEAGAGSMMTATMIRAGDKRIGGGPAANDYPKVDNQVVSVVNDVTRWNAGATGNYSGTEAIGQRTLSANEKSMILSFTLQDPSAEVSVGTGPAPFGK